MTPAEFYILCFLICFWPVVICCFLVNTYLTIQESIDGFTDVLWDILHAVDPKNPRIHTDGFGIKHRIVSRGPLP